MIGGNIGKISKFGRMFTATAPQCDPYWGNVSLLLHMDGASGATTFPDSSWSPKTVTRTGNTVVNTTIFKYGTGSAYFDGNGDYLSTAISPVITIPVNGNFTLECWIYPTDTNLTKTIITMQQAGSPADVMWLIGRNSANKLLLFVGGSGIGYNHIVGTTIITSSVWHHVALTRETDTMKLWLDGILQGSWTSSSGVFSTNSSSGMVFYKSILGSYYGTSEFFSGYIDDARITTGVARYTANFTPPSSAFPDVDCGYTTFVDLTINNYPVAPTPTAYTLSTDLVPTFPVAPTPTTWTLATDLVQTYPIAASSTVVKNFMGEYPSTIGVTLGNNTLLYTEAVSTIPVTLGNNTLLYTEAVSTIPVTLGPEDPEPSTDPNWANVTLLLHLDESAGSTSTVDSSSAPKTITFAGTSSLASANTRDTTNNLSVATNGYISAAQGAGLITATGDFTIELWFNQQSLAQCVLFRIEGGVSPNSESWNRLEVGIGSGNSGYFFTENGVRITTGALFSPTTWQYIALTRQSGIYRLFGNGALAGSYTRTTSQTSTTSSLEIGGHTGGGGTTYLAGWIDEVRVTSGVARYTAEFSPRLQPFPNS